MPDELELPAYRDGATVTGPTPAELLAAAERADAAEAARGLEIDSIAATLAALAIAVEHGLPEGEIVAVLTGARDRLRAVAKEVLP